MTTKMQDHVRDLMSTESCCTIPAHETLDRAAQLMREEGVGALPIMGADQRFEGIVTDRDIVVKCVAAGHDPSQVTAGDLSSGLYSVSPDTTVQEALEVMEKNQVKRLPVIKDNRMVGMISEADLARNLPDAQLAEFVHRIYARAGGKRGAGGGK
ncbi:CBS domain-containing protein [Actinocorallia libanotica]|uniref:Hypoxic response protein Hrp1 n=1 Tax=Actinocorallia libanotica TaxID=46162 RepID=A0ABP4BYV1_9ACTN